MQCWPGVAHQSAFDQPDRADQDQIQRQVEHSCDGEHFENRKCLAHQAFGVAGDFQHGDGRGKAGAFDHQHKFVAIGGQSSYK